MVYHLPKFLKNDIPFKAFTGQGVEKVNDIVRSIYHNKSNKHDPCKEAILALKRIDHLQEFEREPNKYSKTNREYWSATIFEQRRKRPRLCVDPREDDDMEVISTDIDNMSVHDMKEKLREMKISTKVRRADKLREILRKALCDLNDIQGQI